MSFIPCYDLGAPNMPGGKFIISSTTPVYSSYSGDLIGFGQIPIGTKCDASFGSEKYGQSYHVIERDSNGNCMAHGIYKR
jgi:hypothetical protein